MSVPVQLLPVESELLVPESHGSGDFRVLNEIVNRMRGKKVGEYIKERVSDFDVSKLSNANDYIYNANFDQILLKKIVNDFVEAFIKVSRSPKTEENVSEWIKAFTNDNFIYMTADGGVKVGQQKIIEMLTRQMKAVRTLKFEKVTDVIMKYNYFYLRIENELPNGGVFYNITNFYLDDNGKIVLMEDYYDRVESGVEVCKFVLGDCCCHCGCECWPFLKYQILPMLFGVCCCGCK